MSFDSKELARLIDAFRALERRDPEGIEGQLEDYLFAHRESILARLEAADALADAAGVALDGDRELVGENFAALWNACGDYEKAKWA